MPKSALGERAITDLLPHRYPLLLVDRVSELGETEIVAEKFVGHSEPVFRGHFPDRPIFPGVYILEALAQTAGLWALTQRPQFEGMQPMLVGADDVRFRRPVVPGDVLTLHIRLLRERGNMLRFEGVARVEGEVAAEAIMLAAFVEKGAS